MSPQGMKKTVGCFTEAELKCRAMQPNVTVMQQEHTIEYNPWPVDRVKRAVRALIDRQSTHSSGDTTDLSAELEEFSRKYTVFFSKLTDAEFVADAANVAMVLQLIELRERVEQHTLAEEEAKALAADIVMESLVHRVASNGAAATRNATVAAVVADV